MSGRLPAGACDAHCHVFGPQAVFPFAEGRTYTPADAPATALAALHKRLGLDRAVLVQPGAHGLDHSAMLDAIAKSDGAWRGVALAVQDTTEAELAALHAGGVRGLRFNFVPHLGAPPSPAGFRRLAGMAGDLGWHIALHLTLKDLSVAETYLDGLATPFVIDHMARPDAADGGLEQPSFRRLLAVLERPAAWVKISGADRAWRAARRHDHHVRRLRPLRHSRPLIEAIRDSGVKDLTVVSNNAGIDGAASACCWRPGRSGR
jgi:2-pyrone-4,6-dicarboxylate lactonase